MSPHGCRMLTMQLAVVIVQPALATAVGQGQALRCNLQAMPLFFDPDVGRERGLPA